MKKNALAAALGVAMAAAAEARQHAGVASQASAKLPGRMELVLAKADATKADLYIYGDIGESWWSESVTASDVVKQLNELDDAVTTLDVYINSYGGSVSDGLSIYNALKRRAKAGVTVNTHVDGIAASIASLILMAGDTVTMASNTRLMIHAPWGGLYVTGNSKEVREAAAQFADVLDGFSEAMAASYASKSGMSEAAALALLTDGADHWYSAQQAKDAGLCDVISDADEDEAAADAATAQLIAQPAFARFFDGMPVQLAAQLRGGTPAANPVPQASARDTQAATSAVTTTGDHQMDPKQKPADTDPTANDVLASLRSRNAEIKAMAEPHFHNPQVRAYYDQVIAEANPDVTAADVGKQILALMAKDATAVAGRATAGADSRDKMREGMGKALQARAGLDKHDASNPYRGDTMFDMARASAEAAGVNTRGMDKRDIVRASITHTSSDFPNLLGDAVRRAALQGYEEYPEVFPEFTRAISVADFRKTSLAGLGQFMGVQKVAEGAEYKYGTFSDTGAEIQLAKRGAIFSITDEAIINDDLNLLSNVPRKMAAAAKRSLGDDVFAILTANANLADGNPLFHASHGNLLTGAAISTTSVDAMIAAMAVQTDADGNTIRVPLKFIVVPVGLGGLARTVLESQFEVTASGKNNTTPNIVRNRFVVIEDPRLDADDITNWYGVADPMVFDSLVVAYRDGVQAPQVTQKEGWNIDGIEFKVRLDAAAGLAGYQGLAKNPGP